jgi:hypothetical protein
MPRERPKIGEWDEEEAFAAFEGHIDNHDISKEDLMKLRPWHSTPWKAHKCKISVGDLAPDSNVVTLEGYETNLHSILYPQERKEKKEDDGEEDGTATTPTRPVVLLFGSITCPPFRSMFLKEICDSIRDLKGKVRLLVVYLAEAHPKDGWHLKVNDEHDLAVRQHETIEQRIASAKQLLKLYPDDLLLEEESLVTDSIDNDADQHYEAQSSRIYVIHDKKIAYQSEVGPFQISPSSLQAFLWEWPVLLNQQQGEEQVQVQESD